MREEWRPIVCHKPALLIVEERLREQQGASMRMREEMPLDELALRVLIAAQMGQVPRLS